MCNICRMHIKEELIPFDLERALAGDPVITRDGRHITKIHLYKDDLKYPLSVKIEDETIISYSLDGKFVNGGDTDDDLFMLNTY